MFRSILTFEIRYWLKQPFFYGVTFFFFAMAFGAVTSDSVQLGGAIGNVHRNAPAVIIQILSVMSVIGVFVITAFMASAVHRDFAWDTHELFFSRPIRRFDYLIGRFTGALFISLLVMIGTALGIVIGSFMPWLDPERIGPFEIAPYLYMLLMVVLPNLFFIGAVFFTLAALSRSMMATYMGVVAFFTIYAITALMMGDVESESVAALIDPFGIAAIEQAMKYWTVVEQNTALPPIVGTLLWNRLIWIAVGLAVLAGCVVTFRFTARGGGRRGRKRAAAAAEEDTTVEAPGRTAVEIPTVARTFTAGAAVRHYLLRTRHEAAGVFRSIPFLVILAFGMFNVIGGVSFTEQMYGTAVHPVTRYMLSAMQGSFLFLLVIIVTFYAGELIWKERSLKIGEVFDALPTPDWVFFGSKLTALFLVVFAFVVVGILTTIGYQLYRGYTDLEPVLYAKGFVVAVVPFCLVAVLAVALQVLTNNRFLGYLFMILYLVSQVVLNVMDYDHYLYRFAGSPDAPYSDMNGYGHFVAPLFWYNLYWTFFALVLGGLCVLFQVRGTDAGWRTRLRGARLRWRGPVRGVIAVGVAGFLGTGAWIYYNTAVLNEYIPTDLAEKRRAEYEKEYRQYIDVPQPRIAAVRTDVDIYPEERRVEARGRYALVNRTGAPIDSLHLRIPRVVKVDRLDFRPHRVLLEDRDLGYSIYRFEEPLAPGDTMSLDWAVTIENPGFVNNGSNTSVVRNGTFFNNMEYFPSIGYDESVQLVDRNTRRKYDLPPVRRMPRLEDEAARRNTYFTRDADWITFETTVSTRDGQIAIAPGYLQDEWTEDGRRYFHYTMDIPILHFYSYLSADYTVRRDRWRDVAIEIDYHAPHDWNVDRMIESVKRSLDYFTENFGPYQHRQVRIVEFPRYAQFAQSFPNTIPYSESIGFVAEVRDEEDLDYVFYVTAHEVAHQWWAHQVIGANVQGATFLSESLAQYSALMVMEKEYGREKMRRFLKYELDRYLSNRGGELVEETPLERVENQPYVHYQKASLVMYALRDYLGEAVLNGAIRRFRDEWAFRGPPYPTTRDFLAQVREVTPDSLAYVLEDMFETITLYSNRVEEAEYTRREDGRYDVRLTVEAKKMRADGQGVETEIPVADYVDIGVFGEEEVDGETEERVLYLEKHRIDRNTMTFEIVVDAEPVRAGIDPYNKLVDRNSDDNVKRVVDAS